MIQFIPKGVGWGRGRGSVQAGQVLLHQLGKSFIYGSGFVRRVMLKQENTFPKL